MRKYKECNGKQGGQMSRLFWSMPSTLVTHLNISQRIRPISSSVSSDLLDWIVGNNFWHSLKKFIGQKTVGYFVVYNLKFSSHINKTNLKSLTCYCCMNILELVYTAYLSLNLNYWVEITKINFYEIIKIQFYCLT